jgi:shikimate kinase
MENLRRGSQVVYLRVSFDALNARLKDIRQRGVVMKPGQTLRDIYEERTALYEKYADIRVDGTGKGIEEVVQEVADRIRRTA